MKISFMRVVRTIHLYCGVVLVPLVLMYGISALTFHHPSLRLSNQAEIYSISGESINKLGFGRYANAPELAKQVISSLQRMGQDIQLIGEEPRLVGDFVYNSSADGKNLTINIDPRTMTGKAVELPVGSNGIRRLRLTQPIDKNWLDYSTATVEAVVRGELKKPFELQVTSTPNLIMDIVLAGEPVIAQYDFDRNTISVARSDTDTLPILEFLTRMHTRHGYNSKGGIQLVWAVLVDCMAISMIVWGITGIIMALKAVRRRKRRTLILMSSLSLVVWLLSRMFTLSLFA